ncbi:MAG: M3 family oligoendopeptidase [Nitrososphaerota archaeon]|nr:M3 family oligoendopeptidase [Nitrososphaerota archaeon]
MNSTVYEAGRWRLSDVLDEGPNSYSRVKKDVYTEMKRFEALRPKLSMATASEVMNALTMLERISESTARLASYSYMKFSEDTRSEKASAEFAATQDFLAEVENRTMFFRLWWISLPEEKHRTLVPSGDPDFVYFLSSIRKRAPHTLQEPVEQAINLKNTTGSNAWVRHYERLTSEFTYRVRVNGKLLKDESGKPKTFVTSELVRLAFSPDPATRKAAYVTLFRKYAEQGKHLGDIYRNIVKDWYNENVTLRNYRTPISARNLENDISDLTVEVLLATCRENASVFQDFFRLKAKMLGMRRLRRYDIYAPVKKEEARTGYSEAVTTVLSAFSKFDAGFSSLAKKVFDSQHVDSEIRPGKVSGAYCSQVTPKITPYILLSYSGTTRDVYTIAHESGHAVHDQLASRHSILTYSPPLVLAETASVFGEMILYDYMTERVADKGTLSGILEEKLAEMYSTIQRQAYFVLFELSAHKAAQDGKTVDDLNRIYIELLREQFGDSVDVPNEFMWEWTYIPHIYHTPFYCYAYAFGNLLTLALYDEYRERGREFVPKYMRVLEYGGSASPHKILSEVGVDLESKEFWRRGFGVLRELTTKLKEIHE